MEKVLSLDDEEIKLACKMCSWDTYCVLPPEVDKSFVDNEIQKSIEKDKESETGMGMGSLLTTMLFAGKESTGKQCPIFTMRLKSSRDFADKIKAIMAEG